jgi:phosphatidylglycerophosphate synthase
LIVKIKRRIEFMFKKENITIPNILSLSRLVLLPVLFIFVHMENMEVAFVISYAVLGSTDFFDGLIARKLNQTSELGKRLDSIADLPFYISSAYFIAKLRPEYLEPNKTILYIFFGLLALSFIISGIKLKQPMLMHSIMLKFCGVLVYFLVILTPLVNTTIFMTVILCLYFVSFTEEIIIFLKYDTVDPDAKSLFHLMKEDRKKAALKEKDAA